MVEEEDRIASNKDNIDAYHSLLQSSHHSDISVDTLSEGNIKLYQVIHVYTSVLYRISCISITDCYI